MIIYDEKSKKEMINALRILKKVCDEQDEGCEQCPFGRQDGSCLMQTVSPTYYRLIEETHSWKAFY